jgi:hypothetical protein
MSAATSGGKGFIALAALAIFSGHAAADPLLPLTDNQKPPYLAVWLEPKSQPQGMDEYGKWLNRQSVWADISPGMFGPPAKTWAEVELPFETKYAAWKTAAPNRRAILIAPMLPTDGSTLEAGAAGTYNSHFTALAQNLVANKLGDTIICFTLGNSGMVPWRAAGGAAAANFAKFWRQIVTTMRAVPGAEKLQFDLVGDSANPIEAGYPGDDVVDYIGLEVEEGSSDPHAYPSPPFASATEKLYREKISWDGTTFPRLEKWRAYAESHHKPLTFPRWYLSAGHARISGVDAPVFIQGMHDYIADPTHHVYFASYFEYYHYSKLSPVDGYKTVEPLSTALFHQLFALPANP